MLSFVLFVTPGSALMFFIYRFIRARELVSVARTDAARMGARLEAAEESSAVAQGTAREAMAQTGEALAIARTIELVDDKVTSLTDYLVGQIEGAAGWRAGRHSRHAVPGMDGFPAITRGAQDEEGRS